MAHFARTENNIVQQVIVVNNDVITDSDGVEQEQLGIDFCKSLYGEDTVWVQTSYNSNFRKNYAGIGYTYDKERDAFIEPKPFASWLLNEESCLWEAPVPRPTDDGVYAWNENDQSWDKIRVNN